jgi:membrane-associated phospholipid phosphatase
MVCWAAVRGIRFMRWTPSRSDFDHPVGVERGSVLDRVRRAASNGLWADRREVRVLALGAAVYFGGRVIVEGSESRGLVNADRLLRFESALGFDIEGSVQELALDSAVVRELGNLSYVWLHWPLLLVILTVLFTRERQTYIALRNAMFVTGLIGLVLFAVFPEAPPRFLEGYVGTVDEGARRHYLPVPLSWTNRYAAFPSFHVGWTLVACLALESTLRRSWRIVAMVPAVLVGVAVVVTGNHYVMDALAGTVLALVAFEVFRHRTSDSTEVGHDALVE